MDGTVAPVFDPKDKMRATDDKKPRRSLPLISFFSSLPLFQASQTEQEDQEGEGAPSVVTQ